MLWLIRGLPGSGKTFLARRWFRGFFHIEQDMFMMREGEYVFDPDKLSRNHAYCKEICEGALLLGADCVVSNTFTQLWEIIDYISMAKRIGTDYQIITKRAVFSETPIHGVPAEKVQQMANRWERVTGETVIGSHRTMDGHMLRLIKKHQPDRYRWIQERGLLVETSIHS